MVAHLAAHYVVGLVRTTDGDGRTAFEVRPATGAPIRFVLTDFPGIEVRAGLLVNDRFPSCGCDACDETADTELDRLEETVFAIVRGGLAERLPSPTAGGATWLRGPDFGSGSGGVPAPADLDRLVTDEEVARLEGRPWPPWPRR